MNLVVESLVLGVSVVVVFAVVHMLLMKVAPVQSMEHSGIFLAVFLAVVIAHLLSEAVGMNKKLCEDR